MSLLGLEPELFAVVAQLPLVFGLTVLTAFVGKGFRDKAFGYLALAWGLNFLYLIATRWEATLPVPAADFTVELGFVASKFLTIASAVAFWWSAKEMTPQVRFKHIRSVGVWTIAGSAFIAFLTTLLGEFVWNHAIERVEWLFVLPSVLLHFVALMALCGGIRDMAEPPHRLVARDIYLFLGGATLYLLIQPLVLFAIPFHDHPAASLGAWTVNDIGFGAGFVAKASIFFGLIVILQVIAARSERLRTVERVKARILHELGTPIPQLELELEQFQRGKKIGRGDLRRLHQVAVRANAILGAAGDVPTEAFFFEAGMDPDIMSLPPELDREGTFSVNTVLEIGRMAISKTREERVKFRAELAGNCCFTGNPIHLTQVVVNLMRNACDSFSDGAGVISIRSINGRWIGGEVQENTEILTILISDDGEGISERHMSRVRLEEFSTRGTSDQGRGYGLRIVSEKLARLGGEFDLISPGTLGSSEARPGTDAVVYLPRTKCSKKTPASGR